MTDDEQIVLEMVKLRAELPGDDEWLVLDEAVLVGWTQANGYYVHVQCSDVFFWGSADSEPVTMQTLDALKAALQDCVSAWWDAPVFSEERDRIATAGATLYCARQRSMRPQGAVYRYIPEKLWPLFDAAGPERETGLGNPYDQGQSPGASDAQ